MSLLSHLFWEGEKCCCLRGSNHRPSGGRRTFLVVGEEKICGHSGSNHRPSLGRECIFERGEEKNLVATRDRTSDLGGAFSQKVVRNFWTFFFFKFFSENVFKTLLRGKETTRKKYRIVFEKYDFLIKNRKNRWKKKVVRNFLTN